MANRKAEKSISLTLPIHYVAKHFSPHNSSTFNIYNIINCIIAKKRERETSFWDHHPIAEAVFTI